MPWAVRGNQHKNRQRLRLRCEIYLIVRVGSPCVSVCCLYRAWGSEQRGRDVKRASCDAQAITSRLRGDARTHPCVTVQAAQTRPVECSNTARVYTSHTCSGVTKPIDGCFSPSSRRVASSMSSPSFSAFASTWVAHWGDCGSQRECRTSCCIYIHAKHKGQHTRAKFASAPAESAPTQGYISSCP